MPPLARPLRTTTTPSVRPRLRWSCAAVRPILPLSTRCSLASARGRCASARMAAARGAPTACWATRRTWLLASWCRRAPGRSSSASVRPSRCAIASRWRRWASARSRARPARSRSMRWPASVRRRYCNWRCSTTRRRSAATPNWRRSAARSPRPHGDTDRSCASRARPAPARAIWPRPRRRLRLRRASP